MRAMRKLETDYLVIGAGATGLAFVDTLIKHSDAEVLIVDRVGVPGGHWVDGYPFLRLHQASANYGTDSRRLGEDRIAADGFYERATGAEVRAYYDRVLHDDLLTTGRVRYLGLAEYRGEDSQGHHLVSLLDGAETVVDVRRKLVDATYIQSEIPARHSPSFPFDSAVQLVTPNTLPDHLGSKAGYTVVGAGKTSMDTCGWLLDQGVDPDRIRWIKPGESYLFNRARVQPLQLVGAFMHMQGVWVEAAAQAEDGGDFAQRLEAEDVFVRIDRGTEAKVFRGATISEAEVEQLRSLERVVRKGRITGIEPDRVVLQRGEEPSPPGEVYVDCTAAGVPPAQPKPVFEPRRVTPQYVTVGGACWSAATIGFVEATSRSDEEKNRLCPVVSFSGRVDDLLGLVFHGMQGLMGRMAEPDVASWTERTRLNPTAGVMSRLDDPEVGAGFTAMATHAGAAMRNLSARTGAAKLARA